jgi:hypothetical protein
MADNILLNLGSGGDTVAADEVSSNPLTLGGTLPTIKHELVKAEFGPDGAATMVEDKIGSRLPVKLGDGSVEETLKLILIEMRIQTEFLKQGLNIQDEPDRYRNDFTFTNI